MGDLWAEGRQQRRDAVQPLARRLRPRTLDDVAGQAHVLGPGKLLRRMLDAGRLTSVVFWGPPGTGKTSLAEVIARDTGSHFEQANAAMIGVKDLRLLLRAATRRLEDHDQQTILFLDEIHRFARNQQDVLLDDVEQGLITLIGATTENPYFALNSALISRSTLFRFEPLTEAEIVQLLRQAIKDDRGFGHLDIRLDDHALSLWATKSDGDARRALNALEVAVLSQATPLASAGDASGSRQPVIIDRQCAEESIQAKAIVYDGTGDQHFDVISAFIKSMRGSDPDAAIYWLAVMLEAGEDPRFIARRIAILASEDIGLADPHALTVAASAYTITERIGLPECQLTLAQATIYMACAPKSNAAARAIWSAAADVRDGRTVSVPKDLRDAHYAGAKHLEHGENYVSPHDTVDGYVKQDYLGVQRLYYQPTARGFESGLRDRLAQLRGQASASSEA